MRPFVKSLTWRAAGPGICHGIGRLFWMSRAGRGHPSLDPHLPADAAMLRLPFLRALRAHHRLHHDPRHMRTKNFNVVLPLFDWLFGTLARERSRPC